MSYSWGSDTGGSGSIKSDLGYDYASARAAYAKSKPKSKRIPSEATSSTPKSVKGRHGSIPPPVARDGDLVTTSTHPVVVSLDVTGSMSTWPNLILERLALLGKEIEHHAPNYALCISAFGNAEFDSDPIQVPEFESGPPLEKLVEKIYPEGGGVDGRQSSPLIAYYFLNHCKMDEAVKPIFFIITDAFCNNKITKTVVKRFIGDNIEEDLDPEDIIHKLQEIFSIFVILRQDACHEYWSGIVGHERVLPLHQPRDIIELIIGTVAKEVGELDDFISRASERHKDKPDRVERVMKSILKGKDDDTTDPDSEESGKSSMVSKKMSSKSVKSEKLV